MATRTARIARGRRGRQRGVSAIVLAAGQSSRMGEPKPLLPLRGKPLLVHVLDALRASEVGEIVVVLGAESDRVRREIPMEGARVVVNPAYQDGMSSSIRAGLRTAATAAAGFLIVLGDQPLLTAATVDALVDRQEATGARILVPTFEGVRGNPVLFHRALHAEIDAVTGDVGCRGVIARHQAEVLEVPVDDPGILVDIDTPEDAKRVEDALARGRGLDALVDRRAR